MSGKVTITHLRTWRRALWDEDVPSREAWLVECADHPELGKDSSGEPWGYAESGRARGVATRHRNAYHGGQL